VAKQLKLLFLDGFPDDERRSYIDYIHQNIYQTMLTLIENSKKFGLSLDPTLQESIDKHFSAISNNNKINPQLAQLITQLWQEPVIQEVYERRNEFQLMDSADYFFSNIDRIITANYLPTVQDIFRIRITTTGVTELVFNANGHNFRLVDVGGQRSERKKWIHCFEGITAVLFCVALSEYDQKLYEDTNINRMHESLKLFKEICTSKWFRDTAMMLFLNKIDLFKQKILSNKYITTCFPEYSGPNTVDDSLEFIQEKFTNVEDPITNRTIRVYSHVTCAVSTENIQMVFESVRDFIVFQLLQTAAVV